MNINKFIQSELNSTNKRAEKSGDYSTAFVQPYLLSNYVYTLHQVEKMSEETIFLLLDTAYAAYNNYYIPLVKDVAFEIFRNDHGHDPQEVELSDMDKNRVEMHVLDRNTYRELETRFQYESSGTKQNIFELAKDTLLNQRCIGNYLEETFYLLSDRLSYSEGFYQRTAKAVSQWQRKLPTLEEFEGLSFKQKMQMQAEIQSNLEQKLDPGLKLESLAKQVRPEILPDEDPDCEIVNHMLVVKDKIIKYSLGQFDEESLAGNGFYLKDYNLISAYMNYTAFNDITDKQVKEVQLAVQRISDDKKRKGIHLEFLGNDMHVYSCSFLNYLWALEITAHETIHMHQQKCLYAYLADPEMAKKLSGMTDVDFKIGNLSDILYVDVTENNARYQNNPMEKHAYAIQDKFAEFYSKKYRYNLV